MCRTICEPGPGGSFSICSQNLEKVNQPKQENKQISEIQLTLERQIKLPFKLLQHLSKKKKNHIKEDLLS